MMKTAHSLCLMMMMVMMKASAAPLPVSVGHGNDDDQVTVNLHLQNTTEEEMSSRDNTLNGTLTNGTLTNGTLTNGTEAASTYLFLLPQRNPNKLEPSLESEKNLQQLNMTDEASTNRTDVLSSHSRSTGSVEYAAPAAPVPSCQLSICALMNLGHDLQSGGDELAGRSSSDPFGHGK
ncbi:uncharacterized protein AB9X84_019758 isoform 2-T2 [Acanthopagrus schlegelii]